MAQTAQNAKAAPPPTAPQAPKAAKNPKPAKKPKRQKTTKLPKAYRITKKRRKLITTEHLVILIALLFGLVAIMMLLAPCITKKTVLTDESIVNYYMGFKVMFGLEKNLNFNYLMLFTLVFSVTGIVGVILSFALKGKLRKIGYLLATLAFLAAAVFFFLFCVVYPVGYKGGASALKLDEAESNAKYKLGLGAILGGLWSIMAGLLSFIALKGIKEKED